MPTCVVCRNQSNAKGRSLSLFIFPKDGDRLQRWLEAVEPHLQPNWTVERILKLQGGKKKYKAVICSDHFSPSCCEESMKSRLLPGVYRKQYVLSDDAVPTLFGKKSRESLECQLHSEKDRKQLIEDLLNPRTEDQTGHSASLGLQQVGHNGPGEPEQTGQNGPCDSQQVKQEDLWDSQHYGNNGPWDLQQAGHNGPWGSEEGPWNSQEGGQENPCKLQQAGKEYPSEPQQSGHSSAQLLQQLVHLANQQQAAHSKTHVQELGGHDTMSDQKQAGPSNAHEALPMDTNFTTYNDVPSYPTCTADTCLSPGQSFHTYCKPTNSQTAKAGHGVVSTQKPAQWQVDSDCVVRERDREEQSQEGNTETSQLKWSIVKVDDKVEDEQEEEDDFEESEEDFSSSDYEKKGHNSDDSWHLSSEKEDSSEDVSSASSYDSVLEERERQREMQRKYYKNRKYVCDDCGVKFDRVSLYNKHKLEAHPIACELCEEKFPTRGKLKKHLKTHMPGEDKLDLKGNKLTLCDLCGLFFPTWKIKTHKITHSEERPYKCDWENCKSAFKDKYGLDRHVIHVHKNRFSFPCPWEGCEKVFSRKVHVTKHYKVHTGERSCQCSYCGKMFQRPDHLKVHLRIHTGDMPFKCSLCNYSGRQSNCLRWHMKSQHPEHSEQSGNNKGAEPTQDRKRKKGVRKASESEDLVDDTEPKASGSAKHTGRYSRRSRSHRAK